ncbi:unnamed protein product [Sphenostylis stenocarpa]|uniref:FRIGIDA-like protein n=1 Tax=Sphenostylis stenocarpa TaxID=92480 RepID=A0AA86T5D2_9FABA|nr:unnamed protein product [Sphenostylis stenocarpa]
MATPGNLTNGLPSLPPENENDDGDKLAKSVNELNNLSIAIQTFKSRYDELQRHLDFIEHAIDARTKELQPSGSNASPNAKVTIETSISQLDSGKSDSNQKPKHKAEEEEKEKEKEKVKEEKEEDELLSLCKTMNSRGLRKYVLSRLSETASLREQVPVALKSAPKPSKLVFECIGRFFLQGSKAYTKDSPMIPARQVSVLVLEYYLLSGCVGNEEEVEASLKKEADSAAVAWRKRLNAEGGLSKTSEVDARGLILFVAGFGIPSVFRDEDICNLVSVSNYREISDALHQSQLLLKRVSDIADGMIKKGMVVKAVDLAYTFGFEEKYSPQTVLTSFLQKSEETWKKAKQDANDFPNALKQAHEKYLAALKSVVNCLEGHKIDFVKLIPGWQLKDKIINLEKDISDTNKKIEEKSMLKRKVDKNNSSNKMKLPETKRTRFTGRDASVLSPSLAALHEQRIVSRVDGNSLYDGSLSAHLLDGRSYGYPNNYLSAASVQLGSVSDSLAEKYLGSTVASGANILGGAMGGAFSGYHGDMIRDNVGTVLNKNSYRWHGIGEGAISHDRSVGQSFVGQSTTALLNNLYGKASTEGFAGVPEHLSIGASSRGGGSDLYSFADGVFDS